MTTIQIAYDVDAKKVQLIEAHLNEVALRDINWNGADFQIERADFTCIPDEESADAVQLLHTIFDIVRGRYVPKK